jgi:peptidoglycan/LPS O-acetylase OafA/YrhL
MRRVLRIWPLYYVYLIIVVFLNGISNVQWPMLFYFLIIPNFKNSFVGVLNTVVGDRIMTFMVGHYWSLGVEEQFYAFWVLIVKKTKNLLPFLVLFPIAFILLKFNYIIYILKYI